MLCRWPVGRTQPHSRCRASNAGAEHVLRARFFRLEPGLASWPHTDLTGSPTRSVWRFHVPRIWNRSINVCKFPVKRKTQNMVDVYVLCLFVVVLFPDNRRRFNAFRFFASRGTIFCILSKMKRYSLLLALVCSSFLPRPLSAQARPQSFPPSEMRSAYGEKLGITTVVDLRGEDLDTIAWERRQAESLGMRFVHIPVSGWSPPTDEQVVQFLSLFRGEPGQKVFVHCRFGDDRTGVFVATYRMALEKWPAEQALKEMYFFGFNGFWHPSMKTFIREFPAHLNSSPALASPRSALWLRSPDPCLGPSP